MIVVYACSNDNCPAYGGNKPVALEEIAPGLVILPYLVLCVECGLAVPIVSHIGVVAKQ
jgi:hypothetical protein